MHDQDKAYFLTMTVVGWIDVFTRENYKIAIVESLKFCQKNKGLEIYGWCLMTNHLHLIARSSGNIELPEIIRDFKKFTSRKIISQIIDEPESRRKWMLNQFEFAGRHIKAIKNYKFWQTGNHAMTIYSPKVFYRKLNYIHKNPVKSMIVRREEDYLFSSARNYADLDYLIEVVIETPQLITY